MSGIKKNHNLEVLKVNSFLSRGDTRYLVITTDSRAARDVLIKTKVKLFGCEYNPQPKLQTPSRQQQQSSRSVPYRGTTTQANSWRNPPSLYTWVDIPSAQSNNIALPSRSDWAGPKRAPPTSTVYKSGLTVLKPRPRINTIPATRPSTAGAPTTAAGSSEIVSGPQHQQQGQVTVTPVNRPITPPTPATRTRPPTPTTRTRPSTAAPTTRPTPAPTARPTPATRSRPDRQRYTPQQYATPPVVPEHQPKNTKPVQQEPLLQPPTKLNIQGTSVVQTLSVVSEALTKGLEHPEVYLDFMNILHTQH